MKSLHYDLMVIGMGLSGLMAAKTAVEAGEKVLIIGKGLGSLSLFSNTIDLLGSLPPPGVMNGEPRRQTSDAGSRHRRGENPASQDPSFQRINSGPLGVGMADSLSQWMKGHPKHPYSKVGLNRIREALSSFVSLFPPPYSFQAVGEGNSFFPTGAGTLRPTYLIPITMTAGASAKKGDALIVGLKGFKDFYPNYVAHQLGCRGVSLSFPEAFSHDMTATALARLMENASFRESVGREIKKSLQSETRVGFPALLGVRKAWKVKKDLDEIIGAEVFEIPTLPPSIPGMRIYNHFKEWLIQKGAAFHLGYSVSKAVLKEKKCERVDVSIPPLSKSYAADRYILATGRFIGGGLVANEERVSEPIFNLPVDQPRSRDDWVGKSFFDGLPHPVHRSGLMTNELLQPVDENGDILLENVWISGSILAHHHCIDEQSREGIEIATGYTAAKEALKHGA